MKNIPTLLLLVILFSSSCSSTIHAILDKFDHKTPHEEYAEKLDDKGLDKTPEGRAWLAASAYALKDPQAISLPYRQLGFFGADKPRALGLEFNATEGEKITVTLTKKAGPSFVLYADLYKQDGANPLHLLSADTASSQFSFDVEQAGSYLLRLQPELFRTGEYNLLVSVGPSLSFPVSGNKASVGSYWGDDREGGKRRHEGVDIFAPKLTPAIAAANGYITGVKEGGIGGKTVWLRPEGKNYTLYYAHLDKQLVQEGQTVKQGDVVGLVGNTGNAQFTPSHLHFGVYTFAGAVNPLPFINKTTKAAPAAPAKNLSSLLKLTKSQKSGTDSLIKASTVLTPLAVSSTGYIAELPNGKLIKVPFTVVQAVKQPLKTNDMAAQ